MRDNPAVAHRSQPNASGMRLRGRWPEWTAVGLYASIVASAIPLHEPWADEAQAWQIARSLPLGTMLRTYVRYEGSPGLWHFLLWVLIRLHVSYAGLHWICGGIAVASTMLFVMLSPFPRFLRLSLPFTYFLLFQYAVIARSYVLVPPLLFLVAYCWKKHPVTVAILLGLLANVCTHGAVISGGLAIVFCVEQIRAGSLRIPDRRRTMLLCAGIVLCFCILVVWTARKPADVNFTLPHVEPWLIPVPAFVSLTLGIFQPWYLSIFFWIAIVLCLRARSKLIYLLPVLLFAIFSGAVHFDWWHIGLLVPLVLSLLWMTWPAETKSEDRYELACAAALLVLVATQVLWSGYALKFDHDHDYSPDLATAKFLAPLVAKGDRVAVTFYGGTSDKQANRATGILPYFDHDIFLNQTDAFWWWSSRNNTEELFQQALPTHPEVIVMEIRYPGHPEPINLNYPKLRMLFENGYRFTHLFCGRTPIMLKEGPSNCHMIFEYAGNLDRTMGEHAP
jgi:hypothetical protein